jgi:phosphatidylethanolamine/phosphatidyl-N-methylethanolamine N-methyltransferase
MWTETPRWNRLRYTLYAPIYDMFVRRFPLSTRGRRRALELVALRPGERVLIVACGTGLDLEWIDPRVEVTAIDITPAMVERTRARARELGRECRAEVMDAARLEFPDSSYDCVLQHLSLAVVPDPVGTIRETARVLVPGGRVSVFDKFLPDDARPSVFRHAANLVARIVATELNRSLAPLAEAAGLRITRREPAGLRGLFVVARLDKPEV